MQFQKGGAAVGTRAVWAVCTILTMCTSLTTCASGFHRAFNHHCRDRGPAHAQTGRCSVGLLGVGVCSANTEASVTGRRKPAEVVRGAWCKQVWCNLLGVNKSVLVPTGGCVFMLGNGVGRWLLSVPLFLGEPLQEPCPSRTCSEMCE